MILSPSTSRARTHILSMKIFSDPSSPNEMRKYHSLFPGSNILIVDIWNLIGESYTYSTSPGRLVGYYGTGYY